MVLNSKAALSGEVFKESFIDIFHTNLEQVAFSLKSTKALDQDKYSFQTGLPYKCQCLTSALGALPCPVHCAPTCPNPFFAPKGHRASNTFGVSTRARQSATPLANLLASASASASTSQVLRKSSCALYSTHSSNVLRTCKAQKDLFANQRLAKRLVLPGFTPKGLGYCTSLLCFANRRKEEYKSLFYKQSKNELGRQKRFKNLIVKSTRLCKQNACLTCLRSVASKKRSSACPNTCTQCKSLICKGCKGEGANQRCAKVLLPQRGTTFGEVAEPSFTSTRQNPCASLPLHTLCPYGAKCDALVRFARCAKPFSCASNNFFAPSPKVLGHVSTKAKKGLGHGTAKRKEEIQSAMPLLAFAPRATLLCTPLGCKARDVKGHGKKRVRAKTFTYKVKKTPILLNRRIGDYFSSGDKIGHVLPNKGSTPFSSSRKHMCFDYRSCAYTYKLSLFTFASARTNLRFVIARKFAQQVNKTFEECKAQKDLHSTCKDKAKQERTNLCFARYGTSKGSTQYNYEHAQQHINLKSLLLQPFCKKNRCKKSFPLVEKKIGTPIILNSSGRVVTISKTQLILQKTQPVLFYNSANLHVKKGEWVREGSPILTLTHQTLITGDIVQGIPRIEQLFEAFTSPPSAFKDKDRTVTKFKDVHDTLHSQVRDIFRKHWFKNVLPIAVRKSLEEIQYILVESIQKVYLSQGVLISDKHIEIIIRQIASKGQILDSGSTGLFLEEILPIRQIENANLATPGKKCLYVPAVVGLTAAALSSDSFISAASFQETTRVLSRDAVVGKSDFLRGLKEKVVIGDLISAGTGLDIYFIYTTMIAR